MDERQHNSWQKSYFEENNKKTMQPRRSPYIDRQIERMVAEGSLSPQDRILDVGCGIGRYTLNLADRNYSIEGLDIAEGLLQQLLQRKQIPVHCADIAYPPAELLGRFDVVVGFFALHHMFDLESAFAGIAKLLKPGGRVLFLEPNPYNLLYYIQILVTPRMTWRGDKGILQMRRNRIFSAMAKASFAQQKLSRFGFFPPFVADRKWAQRAESILEKVPVWKPLLPFQIFSARMK
jgi:2-polyprenyl-3-methyl-5-hydroxy-6-metoxy-1,4-benzoquinol methylase